MSALGSIDDHMAHGFTQAEAEKLEQLAVRCDAAAMEAAKFGDDQLLELVVEACQHAIDAFTAEVFSKRRLRTLLTELN
ncbi:hypothetical protein AWB90_05295 [Mycobacterium paraense]|uniref:Uncharacterized protein n=1 Tax=Mycobacterium paraense TaxID=767916 RepID=A0A1X2AJP0_9MYCO|nr:hypothetical protein [Mycobacterium paraense]ORW51339.1 hypothetical protein AWB90_05295 [Mycobacterium paraense]